VSKVELSESKVEVLEGMLGLLESRVELLEGMLGLLESRVGHSGIQSERQGKESAQT